MDVLEMQQLMAKMMGSNEKTFEENLETTVNNIKDSYGNELLSIGNNEVTEKFSDYSFTNDTLNYLLWLALYNDSWVFKRAIDKPSQDMINCGISLQNENDLNVEVMKRLKKHKFDFIQLLMWGHLFGGSVAVMMFDTLKDEDYVKPLNVNKLKNFKTMRMYVVDRWYGVSPTYDQTVSKIDSLDFGQPKYYSITFADGHNIKVHHDYILRFEGRTAPKLIKQGQLQGWGYAEGAHILRELSRDEKLKNSIQSLIDKSLIEVIKMDGMKALFLGLDTKNQEQMQKRLEMVNWGRNFNSLTFLDSNDDYQQNTFGGLAGLSDLLENNMWLISSALDMQGILFGDLKGGWSNDAVALERYDATIVGRCESYLRPVYEKFISTLYKIKGEKNSVEFEFNTLYADKQDEKKVEALERFTTLCSKLLTDGVITTTQYAKAMLAYTNKGVMSFGFDEESLVELEEREKEENEAFTFEENENYDITQTKNGDS